jgi:hypothetical protein
VRAEPVHTSVRSVHVQPHTDGWAVIRGDGGRPAGVYLSRRFAIDAGRSLAKRDVADLLVHDDTGRVDFRVSYSRGASGWRWNRRRRSGAPQDVDAPTSSTANLLEVVLPYDSWCVRTARSESAKALNGECPAELLDELLLVITELVLQSTVQTRAECTLLLHRTGDEILIIVRDQRAQAAEPSFDVAAFASEVKSSQSMSDDGMERSQGQRCLWVRFNLPGGQPAD